MSSIGSRLRLDSRLMYRVSSNSALGVARGRITLGIDQAAHKRSNQSASTLIRDICAALITATLIARSAFLPPVFPPFGVLAVSCWLVVSGDSLKTVLIILCHFNSYV